MKGIIEDENLGQVIFFPNLCPESSLPGPPSLNCAEISGLYYARLLACADFPIMQRFSTFFERWGLLISREKKTCNLAPYSIFSVEKTNLNWNRLFLRQQHF